MLLLLFLRAKTGVYKLDYFLFSSFYLLLYFAKNMRLQQFHHKPISIRLVAINRVLIHCFGAPAIFSTYTVNIQVDVQVDKIAVKKLVRMFGLL